MSYETVISYLVLIEPLAWTFPVLSAHKKLLYVEFVSTDDRETKSLLQLLKDCSIVTECIYHISNQNKVIENPDLFGDFNPPLDNLLDSCDIVESSYGEHDTDWNQCDLAIFPYLMMGYKGTKLIEILKKERKLERPWTYEQIKYSHEKMIRSKFIRKEYTVFLFPYLHCVHFILVLKSVETALDQRIARNLARGARVYKEYTLFEDSVLAEFVSHPFFVRFDA